MEPNIEERINNWLQGPYDEAAKTEIKRLEREDPTALVDAFYRDLSFGTGGLRAVMGVGSNRLNIYTVRATTQGLSNYLVHHATGTLRVFIGYDVRHNSRLFAEEAARVLAGNGIEAFLTTEVCPTPLASFGCRFYHCSAALMITASHNPPEYNGYKVYWNDGAQIVAPHDQGIIHEVSKITDPSQVKVAPLNDPHIRIIDRSIDAAYLAALERALPQSKVPKQVRILYTNLHGTGLRLLPSALDRLGFSEVSLVKEQATLDGSFPSAISPNPEEEAALKLGKEQLLATNQELLLATDPDADRLGVLVRHGDQAVRLNGNELGALLLSYLLKTKVRQNGAIIKTIVTSELLRKMADRHNIACFDVLTGFKFIAEQMRLWEEEHSSLEFLFGAEESHGYLFQTFVRDKDGISAGCLLAEAAADAKSQNKTLIDQLYELYRIYGVHRQKLRTLSFSDSPEGMQQMQDLMLSLRKAPPRQLGSLNVLKLDDYLARTSTEIATGKSTLLTLPSSNVLYFGLEGGAKVVVRPSGTEPKVKIYAECCSMPSEKIEEKIQECEVLLQQMIRPLA